MCSNDRNSLLCVRVARIRRFTAAASGQSLTAVWWRTDRDRKRFDQASCEQSACSSAEVRAVSAARRSACRLHDRSFLTSDSTLRWSLSKKAGAGIEPANSGFADRDLTTWLPRRCMRGTKLSWFAIYFNDLTLQ